MQTGRYLRSGIAAAWLCVAAPAEAKIYPLQTILVRVTPGSGAGVNIRKWPHPVQVFSGRDLSENGPANAPDYLSRHATGVNTVNSQANPYQPEILYHGFEISPIQGTPADLSIYVNGARFNTPFGDLALWSLLPDDAIDTLSLADGNPVFGLNALGGAINVQMKNGFRNPGGVAELTFGSFGKIQANLQYGAQSGGTAGYVDVNAAHEAGWRDAQSSDIQNFYGDLGWKTANAELHFNATLANSQLDGPGTVPVEVLAADPRAQFTGPNLIHDKYAKFAATFNDQLTAATSLQAVLYYDNLREYLANGNGPNDLPCAPGSAYLCEGGAGGNISTSRGGAPIPNFLPTPNAAGYDDYSQLNLNTTNTNGYGGSVELTRASAANHLTVGVSFDGGFTKYDADGYIGGITASRFYTAPPGGYLLDEPGTVPVGVVIRNTYEGAYATDTLNLTPDFAITAGGRFNLANIALHDQDAPDPNAPGGGLTGRHFYSHFNPAFGVTYNLTPDLTLFAALSEANAAPTPAELSCASPEDSCSLANFMSGDPDLKQIITRSAEAGLRGTFAAGGAVIAYNADLYRSITADDIEFLQSPYNPIGEGYFSNIGNVQRQGVDAGLRLETTRWQLYANYSLTGATYRNRFIEQSNNPGADANGNITVSPGDHLPGIPENTLKFGAEFQVTQRWKLTLSANVQSSVYLFGDEANLTSPLPGYFTADLGTSYQLTPRLQVFGAVENVTDTKYYNYGTFSPPGVYVAQDPGYSNPRSYSIAAPVGGYAGIKVSF